MLVVTSEGPIHTTNWLGVFQRYYVANDTFPGTTTTMYALVGGCGTFTGFFSGPIVGAIAAKIGNRTTAGVGSVCFALNFIACSFVGLLDPASQ